MSTVVSKPIPRAARRHAEAEANAALNRNSADIESLRSDLLAAADAHEMVPVIDRLLAEIDASGGRQSPWLSHAGRSTPRERAAVAIGKLAHSRSRARIGYLRIPGPRLSTLHINARTGIAATGTSAAASLAEELRSLIAGGVVDSISLNRLQVESPFAAALLSGASARIIMRESPSWRCQLLDPQSGRVRFPLAGRSLRKRRNECRRLHEHFSDTAAIEITQTPEHVDRFLRAAEQVTNASYHSAIGAGIRDTPAWRNILLSESLHNRLLCYTLTTPGGPLAYVCGIVDVHGTYHFEATSFDPAWRALSPGGVLLWHVVHDLLERNVACIDFGSGDAAYKRMYATDDTREMNVQLFSSRLRGVAAHVMTAGASRIHDTLAGCHAASRVKRAWRRRLTGRRCRSNC